MSDHTIKVSAPPTRRCAQCNEVKPLTVEYFHRDRYRPDGYTSACKFCRQPPLYDVPLPPGFKVCPKCNTLKPKTADFFIRSNREPSGFNSRCKACCALYQISRRDELIDYGKAYRAKNNDELNHKQRIKHAKPKSKQRRKERDDQNRPKIRAYARAQTKRWREENPEAWRNRKNIEARRRRTLKMNAPGFHTMDDIYRQHEKQGGKCAYCQCEVGDKYHVDHVLALCNGGSNDPENLVIACPSCNMQKHRKLLYTQWVPSNPMPGIV